MSTLSERIRDAMSMAGINQVDLVRATGAKSSSVANWVGGRTKNLRGQNLVVAARLLNVSEAWLSAGVGPKERAHSSAWPFKNVSSEQFQMLSAEARAHLESYLMYLVEKSACLTGGTDRAGSEYGAGAAQRLREGVKKTSTMLRHHFTKEIVCDDSEVDSSGFKRRRGSGQA